MKRIFLIVFAALCAFSASADEGMWMIHAIDSALEKKMQERGLLTSASAIYDADAQGSTLSDAVVSLDFGCTGSIISDSGLLITNHHCAYSDVHSISTKEHNYLEEGFWAMTAEEEVCIPGKKAFFLKKVIDVTEEVGQLIAKLRSEGKPCGMRKVSHVMEMKYKREYGYDAMLSSMWAGNKYYMSLYEVYSDIRLVAAPPVSIAAFGGDIDNWEWPQHKCDFALYRVYASPDGKPADYSEQNVPMVPKSKLNISLDGYAPDDFTMIIGYPGRTDRYSSSFKVSYKENISLPVTNDIRGHQMQIVNKWMNEDASVRLKYSDYYFTLSNIQELNSGEEICFKRFGTVKAKKEQECRLQDWIDADTLRQSRWGSLTDSMAAQFARTEEVKRNICIFRETIVRGTNISRFATRISSLKNARDKSKSDSRLKAIVHTIDEEMESLDMRVEKDLFKYAVTRYYSDIDGKWLGDFQKELLRVDGIGNDCTDSGEDCAYKGQEHYEASRYEAIADCLWENSFITDAARFDSFVSQEHSLEDYCNDPVIRFLSDVRITDFNKVKDRKEGKCSEISLAKEYTTALYRMRMDKGEPQYPDANSTMRITYGTVGELQPYDGVVCSWKTTTSGILEKYDPDSYEFHLGERQRQLLEKAEWGRWGVADSKSGDDVMQVNFLTDNDITGGNSGSPVLNARGELIGLAFDGNKESLASDAMYVDGYNKCVCVDIRYILWILERYAGMNRIIEELGL